MNTLHWEWVIVGLKVILAFIIIFGYALGFLELGIQIIGIAIIYADLFYVIQEGRRK